MNLQKQDVPIEITFPNYTNMEFLDKNVSNFFASNREHEKGLLFNLARTKFIEVACLIYILTIIEGRKREKLRTFLKLPESKDTRDFLRAWFFPEAAMESSGVKFSKLVLQSDLKFFGENVSIGDQKYAGMTVLSSRGELERLLEYYLPILTFYRKKIHFTSGLALKEADRWKSEVVTAVLEKHLKGPHVYFRSRIVFEAMMNAVRHPNAAIIRTASHLEYPADKSKGANFLTLVWWDDGMSIIDTLREALHQGKSINTGTHDQLITKYYRVLEDSNGTPFDAEIVSSELIPGKNSSDDNLLLASLFPGITRDVSGKGHLTHPEIGSVYHGKLDELDQIERIPINVPGWGLPLLLNAAIHVYKGSVAFRTGKFFMNVKCPKSKQKDCDYAVKIRQYLNNFKFLGNMLTVRLPLRRNKKE